MDDRGIYPSPSRLVYLYSDAELAYGAVPDKRAGVIVRREALDDSGEPDGLYWEFRFTWHDFGRNGEGVRVEVFDDAWVCFFELPELWAALAGWHKETIGAIGMQPSELTQLLDSLGLTNATKFAEPF